MSITKYALIRYHTLDKCLRNTIRNYTVKDLFNACKKSLEEHGLSIQQRQIYDDLTFMMSDEGYSAPIEKRPHGRTVYYRYADPLFSITHRPVNEQELAILQSAIAVFQRIKGLPHYNWLEELIPRMQQHVQLPTDMPTIIAFEENEYLVGKEWLGVLFDAVLAKRPLQIIYHPFNTTIPKHLHAHPYFLKQYNRRWFCWAYTPQDHRVSVLALDRIQHITPLDIPYIPNEWIDFDSYFDDIIGITRFQDAHLTKITFSLSPERQRYIETKPLHASQTKRHHLFDSKGWQVFEITVLPNKELESAILELGAHICVLAPSDFRALIAQHLANAYAHYQTNLE